MRTGLARLLLAQAMVLAGCQAAVPVQGKEPSVAQAVSPAQPSVLTGSGFFVSNRGHLVTAYHVVRDHDSIQVRVGGATRLLPATLLKSDPKSDLALLKVEAATRALDLAHWEAVPVGLEAYVVGYPLPELQGSGIKITEGIYNGEAAARRRRLFQLSAQVQTGNSGGPVLSPDGLVMGVVQSKLDAMTVAQRTRDLPQNVNFATNSQTLVTFLEETDVQAMVRIPRLDVRLRPYQILRLSSESVVMVLARHAPAFVPPAVSP